MGLPDGLDTEVIIGYVMFGILLIIIFYLLGVDFYDYIKEKKGSSFVVSGDGRDKKRGNDSRGGEGGNDSRGIKGGSGSTGKKKEEVKKRKPNLVANDSSYKTQETKL